MQCETLDEVVAEGLGDVADIAALERWLRGPLRSLLPHDAVLLGQSVAHAGGYTAIDRWSFGLPNTYEATISCQGGNVRSPLLTRLLRTQQPVFFDACAPGLEAPTLWFSNFQTAGWSTLLGLMHLDGCGDEVLLTTAAFYNVSRHLGTCGARLQQQVMPYLHGALTRMRLSNSMPPPGPPSVTPHKLTPAEQLIVPLLVQGKTNKEIGKLLGRSDETIKRRVSRLIGRLGVKNRTELAASLLIPRATGTALAFPATVDLFRQDARSGT